MSQGTSVWPPFGDVLDPNARWVLVWHGADGQTGFALEQGDGALPLEYQELGPGLALLSMPWPVGVSSVRLVQHIGTENGRLAVELGAWEVSEAGPPEAAATVPVCNVLPDAEDGFWPLREVDGVRSTQAPPRLDLERHGRVSATVPVAYGAIYLPSSGPAQPLVVQPEGALPLRTTFDIPSTTVASTIESPRATATAGKRDRSTASANTRSPFLSMAGGQQWNPQS